MSQVKWSHDIEWRILELITVGVEDDSPEWHELQSLFASAEIDYAELLDQALRHKLLPMLAYYTTSHPLKLEMPRFVKNHLRMLLDVNRHRLGVFRAEAARVAAAFDDEDICYAATKGTVLESTLYGGTGCRALNDLDFMICPDDRKRVAAVLQGLGYEMGYFDWRNNRVHQFRAQDRVNFLINDDHLPTHVRIIEDSVVRSVAVDCAITFTWARSAIDLPIRPILEHVEHISLPGCPGSRIAALPPAYHFLFIVLHLFREAWLEKWLDWENDVNLIKFGDVARYWRRNVDLILAGGLISIIESAGVREAILWVTVHLDRTLGTRMTSDLGLGSQAADETWLHSAGSAAGGRRHWHGTMRERLRARDRQAIFEPVAPENCRP